MKIVYIDYNIWDKSILVDSEDGRSFCLLEDIEIIKEKAIGDNYYYDQLGYQISLSYEELEERIMKVISEQYDHKLIEVDHFEDVSQDVHKEWNFKGSHTDKIMQKALLECMRYSWKQFDFEAAERYTREFRGAYYLDALPF